MFIIVAGAAAGFFLYGVWGCVMGIVVAIGVLWQWEARKHGGGA
jgi:hypothetical protein